MAKQNEYQATADSVSKKLNKLYRSLSVRERAILGGVLGQAAAAIRPVETTVDLPKSLQMNFNVRRSPVDIVVGESTLKLHVVDAAW